MGESNNDALNKILVTLGVIETKLDQLLKSHDDHELRLRALEKARWIMVGAAAASGGVAGAIARLIG